MLQDDSPGLGRRSERPSAAVRRASRHDPVPWVVGFFVANILFQRVSLLPNTPLSAVTVLVFVWLLIAYYRGLLVLDKHRTLLWLLAAGLSGLLVIPQILVVGTPHISATSWLLLVTTWFPAVARLRDTSLDAYGRTARALARVGVGLSAASIVFIVIQFLGVTYTDYVGEVLPDWLQVQNFATTYKVAWDIPIYKSNAWVALEPSFLSFTLGICAMCALYARMKTWVFLVIFVGILTTVAGSGLAVLGVGLIVMLVRGQLGLIKKQVLALAAVVAVALMSPLGTLMFSRVFEASDTNSSTSMRAIEPYSYLVPRLLTDPAGLLFGQGPGSSRLVVGDRGISGLLVPHIAKLVFDYGLVVGSLLLLVTVVAHTRSPFPALAYSLLFSLLTLQGSAQPLVNCVLAVATWWAPYQALRDRDAGRQERPTRPDDPLAPGETDGLEPAAQAGDLQAVGLARRR